MVTRTKNSPLIVDSPKKLYQDQYASVSFVESIPCVKVKLSGVPQSSEHYQSINQKLIDSLYEGKRNYVKLHLLTDNSHAGLVLEEDVEYYKTNVIPEMEKAGIRYHAIILPENSFLRTIVHEVSLSTKKLKVQYFTSMIAASRWLRSQ